MSTIGGTSGVTSGSDQSGPSNDALRGLDINEFLKLFIAELQNQDPLNPMDNSQILEQIGSMREIAASTKLGDTLDAMLLGQNLNNASGLIGKSIRGLSDDGSTVQGIVERVSVSEGVPRLHVGDKAVKLTNVQEIVEPVAAEEVP